MSFKASQVTLKFFGSSQHNIPLWRYTEFIAVTFIAISLLKGALCNVQHRALQEAKDPNVAFQRVVLKEKQLEFQNQDQI